MTTLATTNNNLENLSEGQLKAIALMQFNDESYFVIDNIVYEGKKDEIEKEWLSECKEANETDDTIYSFADYCVHNCTEIDEIDGNDEKDGYIVLTDEEADEMAANYIKDSLWAFNASFLSGETGIDQSVFEAIQANGKCEGNNDAIESCIDDIDGFIQAAISADGRGHFMSSYDGYENEQTVNNTTFYIYRIN